MAADRVAALQSKGPADVLGADDDGDWEALGAAEVGAGLAESVPGAEDPCGCAWPEPHAVSISAAAATAVVIKNPCEMR
ncbi:hypothetical protein GCM10009712_21780 [Pseudarthrobacter sulfonivorans]